MCNLFGYSGRAASNPLSIKLLAIYGRNRGKDGFGIVRDQTLHRFCGWKGTTNESDSLEVVYGKTLVKEKTNSFTIIGHNRQKSRGLVDIASTHPFEYNDIEDKHYFFAHNGTISNIEELARKYNVEHKYNEVDSKTLGRIIYEHGFNVLTEYEGYAAFSLYDVAENALYLWKGLSECDSATATIERPLFYWQNKNKDKLYYASEVNSLITAINDRSGLHELSPNCLTKIVHGKIVEETYYDRSVIKYKTPGFSHSPVNPTNAYAGGSNTYNAYTKKKKRGVYNAEPCPQNTAKGKIYCWKAKYWINGHLLNGTYFIYEDMQYYQVDESTIDQNTPDICYFLDGYKMKNYEKYIEHKALETDLDKMHVYTLSNIIDPKTIVIRFLNERWEIYKAGQFYYAKKSVFPLYSNVGYNTSEGDLLWEVKKEEVVSESEYVGVMEDENFTLPAKATQESIYNLMEGWPYHEE